MWHIAARISRDVDTLPTLTAALSAALSAERFATYMQWTPGDRALAERLYTYNVQRSAALYGPLHMQEVALRNRADQALEQSFGPNWHLDPAAMTAGYPQDSIAQNLRELRLLRNRIAHYEPIIALPLAQRYADITTLTGWLSPSAAAWIATYSTWPALYPAVPILITDPITGDHRIAAAAIPFLPA